MTRADIGRRFGALALALATMGAVLSGCDSGKSDDSRARIQTLKVAWTSDVTSVNVGEPDSDTELASTVTGDLWVHIDQRTQTVAALDLTDGSAAWSLPIPAVCSISEANSKGLVAVSSGDPGCGTVTLVDTRAGRVRWSKRIDSPSRYHPLTTQGLVGLTARTVTVAANCSVERWTISGRSLAQLGKSVRAPGGCDGSRTTGQVALVPGRSGLVGYDADTGERRWVVRGTDGIIDRLYANDPIVVDLDVRGVRAVRSIDPATGRVGPILGRPMAEIDADAFPVGTVSGDSFVGAYDPLITGMQDTYDSSLRGWDLATGKQEFAFPGTPGGEDYLGSDETGTYVGRTVDTDSSGGYAYWLMRRDAGSRKLRTLGWIDHQVLTSVRVGNLLLVPGADVTGTGTTAYRIPEKTSDVPIPAEKRTYVPTDWAADDIRPDPADDWCADLRPQTLRTLGFARSARLPAPLHCTWQEGDRRLEVSATAYAPTRDGSGEQTGVQAAQDAVMQWRQAGTAAKLPGIGDEAWVQENGSVALAGSGYGGPLLSDPAPTSMTASVVVRLRNLVVTVKASDAGRSATEGPPTGTVSGSRMQRGVRVALDDVVSAATGDSLPAVTTGNDGAVRAVPEICRLRPAAIAMDGWRTRDISVAGEHRLRGCVWSHERGWRRDYLQVVAYAVGPDALTGMDAETAARHLFDGSVGSAADQIKMRGADDASLIRDFGGGRGEWRVAVRKGNLIIVVQTGLEDHPVDAQRGVTKVVRQMLDRIG